MEDLLDELPKMTVFLYDWTTINLHAQITAIHWWPLFNWRLYKVSVNWTIEWDIENLFEDIGLYSKNLEQHLKKQNQTIFWCYEKNLAVIKICRTCKECIRDAYGTLIGQFASEQVKKQENFIRHNRLQKLMTFPQKKKKKIFCCFKEKKSKRIFCLWIQQNGFRLLLLNAKKHFYWTGTISYFGQE